MLIPACISCVLGHPFTFVWMLNDGNKISVYECSWASMWHGYNMFGLGDYADLYFYLQNDVSQSDSLSRNMLLYFLDNIFIIIHVLLGFFGFWYSCNAINKTDLGTLTRLASVNWCILLVTSYNILVLFLWWLHNKLQPL